MPMTQITSFADSVVTPELVKRHGLTPEEFERIKKILGREPNFTELGIFSVMWSEHCWYKNFGQGRRRKCWRGGYWRWLGSRVQDREPQSSKRHRAFPGRRDWRRRYHPRHFYDGRTPRVLPELAAFWSHHRCKFEIRNPKIENRSKPEIIYRCCLRYRTLWKLCRHSDH